MKNKNTKKTNIISISNQKGGEGKTTISIFLAEALAFESPTLLIDWDAQANSTKHFFRNVEYSIFDCLGYRGRAVVATNQVIKKVDENLYLFPSSISLANFNTPYGVEDFTLLRDIVMSFENRFEYIIIDCPPSLGLSLENALIASNFVMIPIQTRAFSVQGISDLSQTISKIQSKANPNLKIIGAVFNQYESNRALSGLAEGVKKYFPVFDTVIPRRESIPQAQVKRARLKDCEKKIQETFKNLAQEVKERIDVQKK